MRGKFTLSVASLVLLFLVSCKKDSGSKSALEGNWNFTSMEVHDSTSNTYNDGYDELDISTFNYLTTNNKGTVSISGGTMTAKGLSYSIDTVLTARFYTDGALWNEYSQPLSIDLPTTNVTSTFKLVGADSIYFPNGGFAAIVSSVTQTVAAGYKYTLSGGTLTMTTSIIKDSTDHSNGFPEQLHESVKATVTLTRQ
jgi:hypothetical protein